MTRALLYLLLLGAALVVARALGPWLLVGAVGLLILAWLRPDALAPHLAHPRISRVPEPVRATPMRFAATVTAIALAMFAVLPDVQGGEPIASIPGSEPGAARETVAVDEEATPSPRPTSRPSRTAAPTPRATARPTPAPVFGRQPTGPVERATVVSITDGDTIRANIGGEEFRVRYIGIDTPEISGGVEWLARRAADANRSLVAGREVILEKDVSETDRYGRLLRYVWLEEDGDWLMVNLQLLRKGLAKVTTYPPDVKYVDELYLPAQRQARRAGRGLWGEPPATPSPRETPVTLIPQQPSNCDPSYPDFCLGVGITDLDCGEIAWRRFTVLWNVPNPDPHRFDGDGDSIGCES